MTIFILKLIALSIAVSIAFGLILGAVMSWGLHYEPPGDLPPLPPGSLHDDDRLTS
jgi:hypothetical protein